MKFQTENGTWYEVKDGYWRRLKTTEKSGTTRSQYGKIIGEPFIKIGYTAVIQDDNIIEGCVTHFLQTSIVTKIEQE